MTFEKVSRIINWAFPVVWVALGIASLTYGFKHDNLDAFLGFAFAVTFFLRATEEVLTLKLVDRRKSV